MMADRQGIEIDYCPKCRGIWLDRGELDKIIERTSEDASPPKSNPEHRHFDNRDHYEHGKYPYKKKKNILGDLFDF
jgi:Zn-finger nucleic acid-binding protein